MWSVSSVQWLSRVWLFVTPWTTAPPGLPVHHQLPESTQTHVHWIGDAIQPSHPLSSSLPPAFNLSQHQGLFSWVSSSHQVAKVLEFQLSPSSEHPGRISFRMDWLDLVVVLSLIFRGTSILFPRVAAPVYISTNGAWQGGKYYER